MDSGGDNSPEERSVSNEAVEHGRSVRGMFARIVSRYDLLNRVMTFGQDGRWRRETVQEACGENPSLILDLGAGTGDLAIEVLHQHPTAMVVAVDFTPEMMIHGREKRDGDRIQWVVADGQYLPFTNAIFDASISGFLTRNLHAVDPVLAEQLRVLAPNGRIASLDTSPPTRASFKPILDLYLNQLVPLLGLILAGDYAAYGYLRDTTKQFLNAEQLIEKMKEAGFVQVRAVKRMFGIIAIHTGRKP